jgi:hypothetical protein
MSVSSTEMAAFFNDMRNGTYKCGFCGGEEFIGNNIGEHVATLRIPASADEALPATGAHPFLSFSCIKCGNSTFFHVQQFNAWRDKKSRQEQK